MGYSVEYPTLKDTLDNSRIRTLVVALERHNTENSNQIFPGKELRGHSLNTYIHVSVSDLYILTIGLPNLLKENRWTDRGII
jgi:hypothetical protein